MGTCQGYPWSERERLNAPGSGLEPALGNALSRLAQE
jgi:hypothetical protein